MTQRLNRDGVSEGSRKRCLLCRAAMQPAAIMTLQIYGAQIRNSVTASPNTSGRSSKPGAMARMMIPAPAMHAKAKNPVHKASLRVTASARPQPEPPRSRSRVQAAVRERDSVPSPNSRRAMYGIRSAAVSASAAPEPPSSHAMPASRTNPKSREMSVPTPTIKVFFEEEDEEGESFLKKGFPASRPCSKRS